MPAAVHVMPPGQLPRQAGKIPPHGKSVELVVELVAVTMVVVLDVVPPTIVIVVVVEVLVAGRMSRALPGKETAPGPGSSPVGSTMPLYDGGTQKTLTSVAACGSSSRRQAALATPVSVIVVANGLRSPPWLCWRHEVKLPLVQSESPSHACGGFSNDEVRSGSKQKPQKTFIIAEVLNAVFVCVPVVSANGTGKLPMKVPFGGGQSWLVG